MTQILWYLLYCLIPLHLHTVVTIAKALTPNAPERRRTVFAVLACIIGPLLYALFSLLVSSDTRFVVVVVAMSIAFITIVNLALVSFSTANTRIPTEKTMLQIGVVVSLVNVVILALYWAARAGLASGTTPMDAMSQRWAKIRRRQMEQAIQEILQRGLGFSTRWDIDCDHDVVVKILDARGESVEGFRTFLAREMRRLEDAKAVLEETVCMPKPGQPSNTQQGQGSGSSSSPSQIQPSAGQTTQNIASPQPLGAATNPQSTPIGQSQQPAQINSNIDPGQSQPSEGQAQKTPSSGSAQVLDKENRDVWDNEKNGYVVTRGGKVLGIYNIMRSNKKLRKQDSEEEIDPMPGTIEDYLVRMTGGSPKPPNETQVKSNQVPDATSGSIIQPTFKFFFHQSMRDENERSHAKSLQIKNANKTVSDIIQFIQKELNEKFKPNTFTANLQALTVFDGVELWTEISNVNEKIQSNGKYKIFIKKKNK